MHHLHSSMLMIHLSKTRLHRRQLRLIFYLGCRLYLTNLGVFVVSGSSQHKHLVMCDFLIASTKQTDGIKVLHVCVSLFQCEH